MKLAAFAAAAFLGGLAGWATAAEQPFDATAWARADYRSGQRNAMADGLLRRDILIGKRRTEVVALFGEPPATNYFSDWDMVYVLGPERGWISIDSEWLVLRLANERVTEARLVRD